VTLANVPDEELQRLNDFHFDVIWLMGVWQTGSYSRELALRDEELFRYLGKVLPDWTEADIASSPYSVSAYRVSEDLGGDAGLVLFRDKLYRRSMRLILDFVPNHTAVECTWVRTNTDEPSGKFDLASVGKKRVRKPRPFYLSSPNHSRQ